jgi:mono/diheme cytochrome c family protein
MQTWQSRIPTGGTRVSLGLALFFGAVAFCGNAWAADEAEGQAIAQQWCASCHAIAPGKSANEQAPPFDTIVKEHGRSADWLRTWLSTPHEMMPDLSLSRQDISDLVAYFETLR